MQPIMQNVANYFMSNNSAINVKIDPIGSNEGLKAMYHDSADIAMSSHEIADSVRGMFRKKKIEFGEFLLAGDALVFVVNVNNGVKKLTSEQVISIYSGETNNWKQVGGEDAPIVLFSRDVNSGTYSFFKDVILDKGHIHNAASSMKDNQTIITSIAKDKNAIGYTSFSNLDYSVNPLDISFDEGKTYVSPRIETINNLKYKYFRGLFLYYKPEAYAKIKPFLDTVKSDTVQKIIRTSGYIPLSHRLISHH